MNYSILICWYWRRKKERKKKKEKPTTIQYNTIYMTVVRPSLMGGPVVIDYPEVKHTINYELAECTTLIKEVVCATSITMCT